MRKLISLSVLVSFVTTSTVGAAGPLNTAVGGLLEQERIDEFAPPAVPAPDAPEDDGLEPPTAQEPAQKAALFDPLAPASEAAPEVPVVPAEGATAEATVPAEQPQSSSGAGSAAPPSAGESSSARGSRLAGALEGSCKGVPAGELGRYIIGNPEDLFTNVGEPGKRTWLFSDLQNDLVAAINNHPNTNVPAECLYDLNIAGLEEAIRYWTARGQQSMCDPADKKDECGWVNSNLRYLARMVNGVDRRLAEAAETAERPATAAPAHGNQRGEGDYSAPASAPARKSASRRASVRRTVASAPSKRASAAQADVIAKGVGKSCSKPAPKPVEKDLSIAGDELRASLCCDVFKTRDKSIKDKSQCDALTKGTASMPGCAANAIRGVLKGAWAQFSALGVIFDRAFWSGLGTLAREFQKNPVEAARKLAKGLMQSLGIDTEYAECLHPGYQDAYWCGVMGNVFTQVGMMAGGWTAFFKILKAGPVVGAASKLPYAGKIASAIRGTRIAAGKAATAVTTNRVVKVATAPARVAGKVMAAPFKIARHPQESLAAAARGVRNAGQTAKAAAAGARKVATGAGQVVKAVRGFSPSASIANMRQGLSKLRADLAGALKRGTSTAGQSSKQAAAQQSVAAGAPNRLEQLAQAEQRVALKSAKLAIVRERGMVTGSGNRLAKLAEAEKRIAVAQNGSAKVAKSAVKAERKVAAEAEVARRGGAHAAPAAPAAEPVEAAAQRAAQALTRKGLAQVRRQLSRDEAQLKKISNTLRKRAKQLSSEDREKMIADMARLSEQITSQQALLAGAPPKLKLRKPIFAGIASGEDSIHHVGVQEKRGDPARRAQWKKLQEQEEKAAAEQQSKSEAEANGQGEGASAGAPASAEEAFARFERQIATDEAVLTVLRNSDPALAKLEDKQILNRVRAEHPKELAGKSDAEVVEIFRQNMLEQVQQQIQREK